jgi:hypothetical protein
MMPFAGNLLFESPQAILETGQLMAQPDAADTAWRDKDALLAQFVARPGLAMCREIDSMLYCSFFRQLIDAVPGVGLAPVLVQQCLDAAFIEGLFVAIEGVSGKSHDLAVSGSRRQSLVDAGNRILIY